MNLLGTEGEPTNYIHNTGVWRVLYEKWSRKV